MRDDPFGRALLARSASRRNVFYTARLLVPRPGNLTPATLVASQDDAMNVVNPPRTDCIPRWVATTKLKLVTAAAGGGR